MITVAQFKQGTTLPDPIYIHKPYVILGSRGDSKGVILAAGDLEYIEKTLARIGTYYDECEIDIRRHDLHANNNDKVKRFYAYVPHRLGWLFTLTLGDRSEYQFTGDPRYALGFETEQEIAKIMDDLAVWPGHYHIFTIKQINS